MIDLPPLPDNVGRKRTAKDISGATMHFTVLDEIKFTQSTYPQKAIYLQKIQFEEDGRIEMRLGYYVIGKKPRMAGKWVWGQYATMLPLNDFNQLIKQAQERGWVEC